MILFWLLLNGLTPTRSIVQMKNETKSKLILALKILGAIITAILGTLGAGTAMTSCKSVTTFSISADSLKVTNPSIEYADSTSVKNPLWK